MVPETSVQTWPHLEGPHPVPEGENFLSAPEQLR